MSSPYVFFTISLCHHFFFLHEYSNIAFKYATFLFYGHLFVRCLIRLLKLKSTCPEIFMGLLSVLFFISVYLLRHSSVPFVQHITLAQCWSCLVEAHPGYPLCLECTHHDCVSLLIFVFDLRILFWGVLFTLRNTKIHLDELFIFSKRLSALNAPFTSPCSL